MAKKATIKIPKFQLQKPIQAKRFGVKMPKLPKFNIKPLKF